MQRRAILFLPFAATPIPAGAATPSNLDVQAHFECLWWSEREMEGINPDRPPPKTTRLRIAKWEYSDPIGVPHPDEVILVVRLRVPRDRAVTLAPRVIWRQRGWGVPQTLPGRRVSLLAGQHQVEEFTIPAAQMILDKGARHMRVGIIVDGQQMLQVELPIQGGD